jgi:hypothetical protein
MATTYPTKRDWLKAAVQDANFREFLAEYRAKLEAPHEPQAFRQTTCCAWWRERGMTCPRSSEGNQLFKMMEATR